MALGRWLCLGGCVPHASLAGAGVLRPAGLSWSDLPVDPAAAAAAAPSRPSRLFPRNLYRSFSASVAATSLSGPAQDRLSSSSATTAMLGLLRRSEPERPMLTGP